MKHLLRLVFSGLISVSAFASASNFHYQESVSGDLSTGFLQDLTFTNSLSDIGSFSLGDNKVSGSLIANDSLWDYADAFSFKIPDGLKLAAASITLSYSNSCSESTCGLLIDGFNDFLVSPISYIFIYPDGDSNLPHMGTIASSGNDTYSIHIIAPVEFGDNGDTQINYDFTFNVQPVPIPASIWLFASCLVLPQFCSHSS